MSTNPDNREPLLVLDCDPGCDDALAIALAIQRQPERRIDFLTVAGNVSADQTAFNATRVLVACLGDQANSRSLAEQYHVFRGAGRSMDGEEPSAASVHGRDGLGDAPNRLIWERESEGTATSKIDGPGFHALLNNFMSPIISAVERYCQLSRNADGIKRFDLLCTGPLTNLACALNLMTKSQQASFWNNCRHFVIMGGSFNSGGNITHSAEFNMFADPIAAQMVLESFDHNVQRPKGRRDTPQGEEQRSLHFVSLDTTELVALPVDADIQPKKGITSPASPFLLYALKQYGLFHSFHCRRPQALLDEGILEKFDSEKYLKAQLAGGAGDSALKRFCYLHDPLAAWILLTGRCAQKPLWNTACIRIDTSRGEGRGRVIVCEAMDHFRPARLPVYGTKVQWLNPSGFEHATRLEFINEMADLLGIRLPPRSAS